MSGQIMREIGTSGVKASAVGLGTWAIGGWMWGGTDEAESIAAIQASLDAGVTLIDTAPAYGLGRSEEIVGKALKGRRDKAVIATKCGLVWHTHLGKGAPVYHAAEHPHLHVVCHSCDAIFSVPSDLLDSAAERLEAELGFTIDIGHVALSGTCRECREKAGSET